MSSARPWRCFSGAGGRLRRGGRSRSLGGRDGGLGCTAEAGWGAGHRECEWDPKGGGRVF